MATIVTRTAKGSALTFAEGDDNFSNLNTDKLENISEDTSPSLGGDLDLLGFDITDTTGNPSIGGFEYPKVSAGAAGGTVTFIDTVRNPNTITLTNGDNLGVVFNTRLRFTGTSLSGNGLVENQDYYVAANIGGNAYEISDTENGGPITITGGGDFSDFNWSAPDLVASVPTNGQTLVWDVANQRFNIGSASLTTLTTALDANDNIIMDARLMAYSEVIADIGTNDNPSIQVSIGNVQKVSITSNLNLTDWGTQAGESVTLLVTGSGNVNGTGNYRFAGGEKALVSLSVVSIVYDGTIYWTSIATDFQV